MKTLKNQKGFTLIELAIVIAVIAILASVIVKGRGMIEHSKVSATAEQMKNIREAAISWKYMKGQSDYTGITNTELTNRNLCKTDDFTNKWGGATTVAADATNARKLQITSAGMPNDTVCGDVLDMVETYFGSDVDTTNSSCSSGTLTLVFQEG